MTVEKPGGIDLNCDTGEAFSFQKNYRPERLFESITSANIACGFHAGDPVQMIRTLRLCSESGVQAGAHPGLPDPLGFGRRRLDISPEELDSYLLYQLGALKYMAGSLGVQLKHVKLHGYLYNMTSSDQELSRRIIGLLERVDKNIILVAPCGSVMHRTALDLGARVAAEAFADRAYDRKGNIVPRSEPGAVITDPAEVIDRVVGIARGEIVSVDGSVLKLKADTVCLHGDTPGAVELAQGIRRALQESAIPVRSMENLVSAPKEG
ncbi:MAG: hypothetical protein JL50_13155 [Peptococcaceae bacterium BICA1-7]|nr:MAG: hypothetical protein JL50_13155 [Peptococcaceae bacterium BICA1-7]HBV99428.1 LamB/YcsF family protein [Desulfotomaculum sp.]